LKKKQTDFSPRKYIFLVQILPIFIYNKWRINSTCSIQVMLLITTTYSYTYWSMLIDLIFNFMLITISTRKNLMHVHIALIVVRIHLNLKDIYVFIQVCKKKRNDLVCNCFASRRTTVSMYYLQFSIYSKQ
jgi:hypothetical protein